MTITILSASDSCNSITGYANVMKEILSRLAKTKNYQCLNQGFQFSGPSLPCLVPEVQPNGQTVWQDTGIVMVARPGNPFNPWAIDMGYLSIYNPDVLFTLGDVWYYHEVANWPWNTLHQKWVAYYEVDGAPIHHSLIPILEKAHYPVSASKFGLEAMRAKSDILKERATCIWHGVDTETFRPLPEEQKLGTRKNLLQLVANDGMTTAEGKKRIEKMQNPFIFGNVARNTERKRIDRLIRAFSIFIENNPDAKRDAMMVIHSDFEERMPGAQDIGELRFKFNVQDYVYRSPLMARFNYGCSRKDLNSLYNCFDVYTSSNSCEGFGVSFIESGAAGVPSITTDYSSGPEIIGDRGWLVPVNDWYYYEHWNLRRAFVDVHKFADAMNEAYTKDLYRKNLGNKMRNWCVANVDWNKCIIPQFDALFQKVTEDKKPKPLSVNKTDGEKDVK